MKQQMKGSVRVNGLAGMSKFMHLAVVLLLFICISITIAEIWYVVRCFFIYSTLGPKGSLKRDLSVYCSAVFVFFELTFGLWAAVLIKIEISSKWANLYWRIWYLGLPVAVIVSVVSALLTTLVK